MATFMMFGKYSAEAMKGMSQERTDKAVSLIGEFDGKVRFSTTPAVEVQDFDKLISNV